MNTTLNNVSTAYMATRRTVRDISALLSQHEPLYAGEHQDDHEHDERDGRRAPHGAVLEAFAVHQVRRGQRGLLRAAGGHRVHLVEDLPGTDQAERQHEEQRGLHERQRDAEETLARARTVE